MITRLQPGPGLGRGLHRPAAMCRSCELSPRRDVLAFSTQPRINEDKALRAKANAWLRGHPAKGSQSTAPESAHCALTTGQCRAHARAEAYGTNQPRRTSSSFVRETQHGRTPSCSAQELNTARGVLFGMKVQAGIWKRVEVTGSMMKSCDV